MPRSHLSKLSLYTFSTASMLIGVGAQSVALLIVARYLGKSTYGQLVSLTALIAVCSSWVQFGTAEMMRRRVALDVKQYPQILGHCLIILFGFGLLTTLLLSIVLTSFVHFGEGRFADFLVIWPFAVCSLLLFPWMVLVEQIFLAHEMYARANLINAGFGAWRAGAAAVACLGFGARSIGDWAAWNLGAYVLASLAGALAVARFGRPSFRLLRQEIPIGATFGVSGFLYNLRANADILALTAIVPPEVVGSYGLARRLVGIAIVTSASLDRLVYSTLVRRSQRGLKQALSAAIKFAGYASILTGVTAVGLYILSPIVIPILFGPSYRDVAPLAQDLCGVVFIIGLQSLAFDSLNAANLHKVQVAISSACVIVGASLVAYLTRTYAISGAISGIYIMELTLAVALWGGLTVLAYKEHLPRLSVLLYRIGVAPRG